MAPPARPLAVRRIAAVAVAVGTVLVSGSALGATASAEPCELLTARDLDRVLGARFEVLFTDEQTICSWASAPGEPPLGVTVATQKVAKRALASAKRFEREQPDAVVVQGLGDLAVASTQRTSPSSTDARLVVFEATNAVGIVVTASEEPSRRQLRQIGAKAVSHL